MMMKEEETMSVEKSNLFLDMSAKLHKIRRHDLSSFPENIHKLSSKTLKRDRERHNKCFNLSQETLFKVV